MNFVFQASAAALSTLGRAFVRLLLLGCSVILQRKGEQALPEELVSFLWLVVVGHKGLVDAVVFLIRYV